MQSQSIPNSPSIRESIHLGVFTLFCFFAFTYNLSEIPPYHADENFYVTSARNMVDSDDYITPIYHEKKRFAKPILFYWLVAASYKTFGINLFSARLVSTFFGALCIPLAYIIARRLFDLKTAIISALLLPGCYLHFQISRWAITDMALNFFILSAFYFFIRGFQGESNRATAYYLAYICMGVGFMIKGPPAIIIPTLVISCYILISRNWKELSQLRLGSGVLVLAIIILPWFTAMLVIHGNEFKNHILGAELRDRIIHDTSFSLYYFLVIIRYYLPWSFFFIAALAVKFGTISTKPISLSLNDGYFLFLKEKLKSWHSKVIKKDNLAFLFSALWIILPLTLFTLFRIEHSRYMLPVSTPIVMITAQFFSQLIDSPTGFQGRAFNVAFYLTLIFYLLTTTLTAMGLLFFAPHFPVPIELTTLLLLNLFGLVALFMFYKLKKYFSMVIALSILQIVFLATLSGNTLSYFNRYPMKLFSDKILSDPQNNKHIGIYQLGSHRARIGVMTGLPAIHLKNPTELKLFIKSKNIAYIVMRETEWGKNFYNLPVTTQAIETGWKEIRMTKLMFQSLLMYGLASQLDEYSESYILLKKTDAMRPIAQLEASSLKNYN